MQEGKFLDKGKSEEEAEGTGEAEELGDGTGNVGKSRTEWKVAKDVISLGLIAMIVRVFCIGYTILWSRGIRNYKFSNDLLCDEHSNLWNYIRCFSYWDGEYFLRLSLNETEYLYEQNHAFFPALPLIIVYIKKLISIFLPNMSSSTCSVHMLIALIINNFFFVISVIGMYVFVYISFNNRIRNVEISSAKKKEKCSDMYYMNNIMDIENCYKFSFFVAFLYIFNIGNIHMSSFYNESIFSCLSIWGFTFLQFSKISKNMNLIFELFAVLSFSLASFFRSNGILFLIPLFIFNLSSCTFCRYCSLLLSSSMGAGKKIHLTPGSNSQIDIHKKRISKENIWIYFQNKRNFVQFVLHWGKALIEAILVILPFIIFQSYAYHLYCVPKHNDLWKEEHKKFHNFLISFLKNPLKYVDILNHTSQNSEFIRRPWCEKTFPFVYNYIQQKYWGVQFLKLFKSPNPNILYAAPVYFLSFHAVYHFFICKTFNINQPYLLLNPFLEGILHLFVLCLYILTFAHTEIILRLVVSSPYFYTHYAYLLKYSDKWNYFLLINLVYFFIGPPLFGTYIAWT
ncbi:hypothetical protein, conserved [Plasmodium gonderi]|uniref:GPI mannosyltransferase 2 n=1 Tax=Plasmodium gonderi TaxID=77519 RepID=A0A1Y1JMM5_PLAGO|nr:hypothetical protein, conserved [Plasmodium gonderi]GAW83836.1 hypothetical protein, conserved [Plasmodium gonderi]